MDGQYHQVLHEHAEEKLDAILEYVRDIPDIKQRVTELGAAVEAVRSDLHVLKVVTKQNNLDINQSSQSIQELSERLVALESHTA
jgi:hypothetical protein